MEPTITLASKRPKFTGFSSVEKKLLADYNSLKARLTDPQAFASRLKTQAKAMEQLFETRLRRHIERVTKLLVTCIGETVPREFLTVLDNAPVGDGGFRIPRHIDSPDLPSDSTPEEIIRGASKMLYIRGWDYGIRQTNKERVVTEQQRSQIIEQKRTKISRGFRFVLNNVADFYGLTSLFDDADELSSEADEQRKFLNSQLRERFMRLRVDVLLQYRFEATRIESATKDVVSRALGNCYIGYELKSQFLETSQPEHEDNDGNLYFIDSRGGSAAPWSERLIAPYRRNCVCYHDPILELPEGFAELVDFEVFNRATPSTLITEEDFGLFFDGNETQRITQSNLPPRRGRSTGYPLILARDPIKFGRWFDRQPMEVKTFFAGSSIMKIGDLSWFEIINEKGRFRSLKEIRTQSQRDSLKAKNLKMLDSQRKATKPNNAVRVEEMIENVNFKLISTHLSGLERARVNRN